MEAVDCDPRRPAYDNWQKEQWNSIVCQRPTTLQNSQCTCLTAFLMEVPVVTAWSSG